MNIRIYTEPCKYRHIASGEKRGKDGVSINNIEIHT